MTTTLETKQPNRLPTVQHCDWCQRKAEEQAEVARKDHLVKNKPTVARLYKTAHLLHLDSRRIKLLTDPENVPAEYFYLSEPIETITPLMIAGEIEELEGVEDASMTHDIYAITSAYGIALNHEYVTTHLDYEIFATKRWAVLPELIEKHDLYRDRKKEGSPKDIDDDGTSLTLF